MSSIYYIKRVKLSLSCIWLLKHALNLGVEFTFPKNVDSLSLSVIFDARQGHQRAISGARRRDRVLNKVKALPDAGNLTGRGHF
jgi:hypothetical protein